MSWLCKIGLHTGDWVVEWFSTETPSRIRIHGFVNWRRCKLCKRFESYTEIYD